MNGQKTIWVCPWKICNEQQAQECRANTQRFKGNASGCGERFPPAMTPEQAAKSILPKATPVAEGGKV